MEVQGYDGLVEIGRGASAVVYRARQRAFDRTVALKVLVTTGLDDDARRRFDRECRSVGNLGWHPRVVPVFDAGVTEAGHPFLVMEHLPAGSLAAALRSSGSLGEDAVVDIGIQVADALEAAHREGILHRDVKPGNLLRDHFGDVKLADFGIASITSANTSVTEALAGTLSFMAPELLAGGRATPASDVYSLGSTLYTLLTARSAFTSATDESPLATLMRIARDPLPDLRRQGVSPAVAEVVEQAMAKEPIDRLATANDLLVALRLVAAGAGRAATPTFVDRRPGSAAPSPAPTSSLDETTRLPGPVGDGPVPASGGGAPDSSGDLTVLRPPPAVAARPADARTSVDLRTSATTSPAVGTDAVTTSDLGFVEHDATETALAAVSPAATRTHDAAAAGRADGADRPSEPPGDRQPTASRRRGRKVVVGAAVCILVAAMAISGQAVAAGRGYSIEVRQDRAVLVHGDPDGFLWVEPSLLTRSEPLPSAWLRRCGPALVDGFRTDDRSVALARLTWIDRALDDVVREPAPIVLNGSGRASFERATKFAIRGLLLDCTDQAGAWFPADGHVSTRETTTVYHFGNPGEAARAAVVARLFGSDAVERVTDFTRPGCRETDPVGRSDSLCGVTSGLIVVIGRDFEP